MSGKASSFQIIHEDYKESRGQGHEGASDRLQKFEEEEVNEEKYILVFEELRREEKYRQF